MKKVTMFILVILLTSCSESSRDHSQGGVIDLAYYNPNEIPSISSENPYVLTTENPYPVTSTENSYSVTSTQNQYPVTPSENSYQCYWMENITGNYNWVPANDIWVGQNGVGFEECRQLDSCDGGDSASLGGCYKWSNGVNGQRVAW